MHNLRFDFSTQTLSWPDLFAILLIIILEIFLSIDNGLVLCNLTSKLKESQRKKALFIGLFTSFILRFILLFFALYLLRFPILKALGGLYLIYLAVHTLRPTRRNKVGHYANFWVTIVMIECIDLIFALDSMLAAYSFTTIYYPYSVLNHKIWVIYLGIIIGVIVLRSAVFTFITFFKKIPYIERIICLFIALMGVKLIVDASLSYTDLSHITHVTIDIIFWILAVLSIFIGFLSTKSRRNG